MKNEFYIDLGTANTLIYGKGRGFILNEPSVLALSRKDPWNCHALALGQPAKNMLGKTPAHISVIRPLKEGVIADFDSTATMLSLFIRRIRDKLFWFRPRLIISLPCRVAEFEKRAVEEVGYSLGARRVHLLDEPLAAAIGAGLPVLGNRAQMAVDIGGGTTEIAVISLGGIVASQAVRIGGDDLDVGIREHLRNTLNFVIGEATAEKIKIHAANAFGPENLGCEAGGIDLNTGLPKKIFVSSEMIKPVVNRFTSEVVAAIQKTLAVCPPEVAGDISTNGIVLAGGGAMLRGLAAEIRGRLGLPVRVAQDPLFSVAYGGAKVLEDHRLFDAVERVS